MKIAHHFRKRFVFIYATPFLRPIAHCTKSAAMLQRAIASARKTPRRVSWEYRDQAHGLQSDNQIPELKKWIQSPLR